MRILIRTVALIAVLFLCVIALFGCVQRRLLYYPSHRDVTAVTRAAGLAPWDIDGEYTGYARVVPNPRRVWLVIHGNAGQAGDRGYVVGRVDPHDAVYVLEYPGYGPRPGRPSQGAFDAAAAKAYDWLVRSFGVDRVMVLGESIGSGPACQLARATVPPRHIVLVVPFDVLTDVAKEKFSFLPVKLLMLDRWNNIAALKNYRGRLDIFGCTYDSIIPVHHARALATAIPGAVFHEFSGGHNDWAASPVVDLSQLE